MDPRPRHSLTDVLKVLWRLRGQAVHRLGEGGGGGEGEREGGGRGGGRGGGGGGRGRGDQSGKSITRLTGM